MTVNVTEQHNKVIVQEDGTVRVVSVGTQGPPGPAGAPGELEPGTAGDMLVHGETEWGPLPVGTEGQILASISGTPAWIASPEIDTSEYDAHLAASTDVHGIADTSVLETQSGAQSKADDAVTAHDVATGVHGVGASTVASADDVSTAQSAAQDHADTAVSDHNAATSVHGVDTTQLATQDDLANLEPLPEPGDDGDVLTLADGSPTWAAPEGGGGLDPDGPETITGDWHFDRDPLHVGSGTSVAIGLGVVFASTRGTSLGHSARSGQNSTAIGDSAGRGSQLKAFSAFVGSAAGDDATQGSMAVVGYQAGMNNTGMRQVALGVQAGTNNSGDHETAVGVAAGNSNSGRDLIAIGRGAGRNNNRHDRLILDTSTDSNGNLVDPLIDGRFRDGTDSDDFEYSKGVKVNGHLEATDQLILHSPDGSRWAITVDDSGNLSTAPATEEITP